MINKHLSIQQFRGFVDLKDLRPTTKRDYIRCLNRLSDHFGGDPATLTEADLRKYFLYLRQERHSCASVMITNKATFKHFYLEFLRKDWRVFSEVLIRRVETLPVVLSREEVARLLAVVRERRFHICLKLIYHCGLRITEAVTLQTHHIKGADLRIHIHDGKGGKDRVVPLAPPMLEELRQWWKEHRNPKWLFPGAGSGWKADRKPLSVALKESDKPMAAAPLQEVFRLARKESAINPEAVIHSLRHSYATHLLEEGVSLRLISQFLGHKSLDTTVIYTHLTSVSEQKARIALQTLHASLSR